MAMFIRVKRQKLTYFLHCDPSDTILEIKQKIQALSDTPVDCQRLILLSSHQILEDHKTLADQKVENDAIVALCFKVSDPRVHRIPTMMRKPLPDSCGPSKESPVEDVGSPEITSGNELKVVPPDIPPERRMSTELRVPFRPQPNAKDSEQIQKDGKAGNPVKNEASMKDNFKGKTESNKNSKGAEKKTLNEIPKKGGKEVSNGGKELSGGKETFKGGKELSGGKETFKGGKEIAKGGKETSKGGKEISKGGKETSKGGKETSKKGGKKMNTEGIDLQQEQAAVPEEDSGVWENITIDKLSNYANLIDSD